jgi:hypothetical protein
VLAREGGIVLDDLDHSAVKLCRCSTSVGACRGYAPARAATPQRSAEHPREGGAPGSPPVAVTAVTDALSRWT